MRRFGLHAFLNGRAAVPVLICMFALSVVINIAFVFRAKNMAACPTSDRDSEEIPSKSRIAKYPTVLNASSSTIEEVIRDLRERFNDQDILPLVVKRIVDYEFEAESLAIARGAAYYDHWVPAERALSIDPETAARIADIDRRKVVRARQLLGPDYRNVSNDDGTYEQQFGRIASEKRELVSELVASYRLETLTNRRSAGLPGAVPDRHSLAAREARFVADLKGILSEAEFEEYSLRNSPEAWRVRAEGGEALTEVEFTKTVKELLSRN